MTAPFFILAGTHSGCGKTTLSAGLMRAFRNRGLRVAPFKAGPDYLDPQLHAVAAGRPSWNLDGWFQEDASLRESCAQGSHGADLALVEGVMGLFDGADPVSFQGSSAELANRLKIPVVLVLDGSGVGGSIAATVLGHQQLWPELQLAGVILNRLSSEGHYRIQQTAIAAHTNVPVLGYALQSKLWQLPERHLGILRPFELPALESALDQLASELSTTMDLDTLQALARPIAGSTLQGWTSTGEIPVALARDEAFCFLYADTLDRLERLGVRWVPFSPLRERLPEGVAGLYLPGGYPELHAAELASNTAFLTDLREAAKRDLPILAECGGYMLMLDALVDLQGRSHAMAGLIPGRALMTEHLQSFGYKRLRAQRDHLLCQAGEEGKAHEFHHSRLETESTCAAWESRDLQGNESLEGFAQGNLVAGYSHIPFSAQPAWAERWVARMRTWLRASEHPVVELQHGSIRRIDF